MKTTFLFPVLLIAVGGCAGGGGGSGSYGSTNDTYHPQPTQQSMPTSVCGWLFGVIPVACAEPIPSQRTVIDDAMREAEEGAQQIPVSLFEAYYGYTPYWASGSSSLAGQSGTRTFQTLEAVGQPGIEVALQASQGDQQSRFVAAPGTGDVTLVANPHVEGWNYQTFGVWDNSAKQNVVPQSFGVPTPANAVPTSGTATFNGKLAGFYVSPAGQGSIATADVSVNADFNARSLAFASSRTATTRDLQSAASAPHLNLSGTFTYAPSTNTFQGTLTNAGGTMSGRSSGHFYGPAAQELGGTFSLRSPNTTEAFTGAYGARR